MVDDRNKPNWARRFRRIQFGLFQGGLPRLVIGPHLGEETPGIAWLMGEMEDFRGNAFGLDEEIVGGIAKFFARPWYVDNRINHEIGDMDALRTQITGQ